MNKRTKITRLGEMVDRRSDVIARSDGDRGANRRVALLLEDEPLISMDVEATLVEAGFEVHCAMSCKDAHDWLDHHRPDVVIVDIVLRDGHCTEVISRLLRARIPFIVHSGDQHCTHIGTSFELGAWVTKPSIPHALVQAVSAATAAHIGLADTPSAGELLKP